MRKEDCNNCRDDSHKEEALSAIDWEYIKRKHPDFLDEVYTLVLKYGILKHCHKFAIYEEGKLAKKYF